MKLLQINESANFGSHGKIAEAIGQLVKTKGGESIIAYGRSKKNSSSQLLKIGNKKDINTHGVLTRILDYHGLGSKDATKQFIKKANEYSPDIIHLHNIHGYYLNYPLLFKWLKEINKPVVWTLHDCWAWTGHCAYYTFNHCNKWQTGCHNCPGLKSYPKSLLDGSKRNYRLKKDTFLGINNMVLVPVSDWLDNELSLSFLKGYRRKVIHNGININIFKPTAERSILKQLGINNKKIVLGVANIWEKRKGLDEFINLRQILDSSYQIILVGLSEKQIKSLPYGITGLTRTNNVEELVQLYSSADVFANPTLEDNFPTTNLEALACGTPVITYQTGGSPEAIDEKTGITVRYQDLTALKEAIVSTCQNKPFLEIDCRIRAEKLFNQDMAFTKYIDLYENLSNANYN